ncbi:type II/IV secretion system protein [Candidatus Aerophobetes bacterium]|nr:type II/IV secretion system protein [Candidatus Aerophobetes bacterium]
MIIKNSKWLIKTLLKEKLTTQHQLTLALARQKETEEPLEKIFLDLNFLDKEQLKHLKEKEPVDKENSLTEHIDPEVLKLIPETIARYYSFIPLSKNGKVLTIAIADPTDVIAIDTARAISGYEINILPGSKENIKRAIERNYSGSLDMKTVLLDLPTEAEVQLGMGIDMAQVELKANDPPVVKFVNLLLLEAIEREASDIHIEPREGKVDIRIRVDGVLQKVPPPPKAMHSAIISRIKILSNLDISERRLPQDGHYLIRTGEKKIDTRVSTFPTMHGEKLVIRLLDKEKLSLSLEELGFTPDQLSKFQKALQRPYGMILETGPTGCGKTTTLYAGLRRINTSEKNIVTIEDPIEYNLEGINQMQIKLKINLTFANSLRSVLRQDPDVILVGEIRDRETAEIAVRAALTGHLVLSTLHTNDAVGAVAQLRYFHIDPYLIGSAINLVIAQRLIRRVCPHCREYHTLSKEILSRLGLTEKKENNFKPVRGRGCPRCNHTGYRGRTAVYQLFEITPQVKKIIFEGANMHTLRVEAMRQGMRTLQQSAVEKLRQGLTTIEEVLSVSLKV